VKVTFLGMGRMGRLIAAHILTAGHELTVWNRTPGKAGELVSRGAREAGTVEEAVADADAVVLMLFGADSVHEVLGRIATAAPAGTLVIDATTTGPEAARQLSDEAAERGLRYVDAPVAGSLGPAKEGMLTILVGGSDEDVADARLLLELWGDPQRIRHLGSPGAGNALKAVVNMCLGIAAAGLGEALKLGTDLHLDRSVVLDALEAGPFGWTIKQKRQMLDSGEFTPASFSLDLMSKDLTAALDSAAGALPLLSTAQQLATRAIEDGRGDQDYATMAGYEAGF
jgi:3-hydroxyisobutyrate dehydrogenase